MCLEGISRSLRIFLEKEQEPIYRVEKPREQMIIKEEVRKYLLLVVATERMLVVLM